MPAVQRLTAAREHPYALASAVALTVGALVLGVSLVADLPLRDPDGLLGPSYVRLPALAALALAADVVPRTLLRARRPGSCRRRSSP